MTQPGGSPLRNFLGAPANSRNARPPGTGYVTPSLLPPALFIAVPRGRVLFMSTCTSLPFMDGWMEGFQSQTNASQLQKIDVEPALCQRPETSDLQLYQMATPTQKRFIGHHCQFGVSKGEGSTADSIAVHQPVQQNLCRLLQNLNVVTEVTLMVAH